METQLVCRQQMVTVSIEIQNVWAHLVYPYHYETITYHLCNWFGQIYYFEICFNYFPTTKVLTIFYNYFLSQSSQGSPQPSLQNLMFFVAKPKWNLETTDWSAVLFNLENNVQTTLCIFKMGYIV